METSTNLKRRDSGEGAAKKVCAEPSCTEDPLESPSNAYPQKQPLPQQVPLLAPFPPLSLPPPPLPLPPMFPPQQPPQHSQPRLPPPKLPLPTNQAHIEAPPFHHIRPHQIVHVRRSKSLERQSPPSIIRIFSLPSLSPISSPEFFPERTPPQDRSSQQQQEEKRHQIVPKNNKKMPKIYVP